MVAANLQTKTIPGSGSGGALFAIEPLAGQQLWRYGLASEPLGDLQVGPDGTVFGVTAGPEPVLFAIDPASGRPKWLYERASALELLSPTVDSTGTVFLISAFEQMLLAMTSADGTLIWPQNVGAPVKFTPQLSPRQQQVAVVAGSTVALLDTNDMATAWQATPGGMLQAAAAINTNQVVVADRLGHVFALDLALGQLRWTVTLPTSTKAAPVFACDGATVLVVADKLYALDADSGAQRWSVATTGSPTTAALVLSDCQTGIVGTSTGKVVAVNMVDGQSKWSSTTSAPVTALSQGAASQPILVSSSNKLYALSSSTGATLWTATIGQGSIPGAAIQMGATVLVGDSLTFVHALNAATGAAIWSDRSQAGLGPWLAAATDGMFYAAGPSGVHMVQAETGFVAWSFSPDAITIAAPIVGADGTLYVGTVDGTLYALLYRPFTFAQSLCSVRALNLIEYGSVVVSAFPGEDRRRRR